MMALQGPPSMAGLQEARVMAERVAKDLKRLHASIDADSIVGDMIYARSGNFCLEDLHDDVSKAQRLAQQLHDELDELETRFEAWRDAEAA